MGVLLRRAFIAAVAAWAIGCTSHTFRLHVDQPAGAELRVDPGPFSGERVLPIPFRATFTPMNGRAAYYVRLVLPAEVAADYGGRGEVTLYGELYVYGATRLARSSQVRLPIEPDRLAALIRGELAEISSWVYDPNVRDERYLARIVLRGQSS